MFLAPPAFSQYIDLGDVVAGGDGSGDAPAGKVGIDPLSGHFETTYIDGPIVFGGPGDDGLVTSPGDGPYVDSVFLVMADPAGPGAEAITQSGISFAFSGAPALGGGWNRILEGRNGGVSTPPIRLAGVDGITSRAVGIHASMGITFDLDALRSKHGSSAVGCFTAFCGLDACAGGDVTQYALLSRDGAPVGTSPVLDVRTVRAQTNQGQWLQMAIPAAARYLTLATVSENDGTCGHGTFGAARIEPSCPTPSFVELYSVDPASVAQAGGTQVTFIGANFILDYLYMIGGVPVTGVELVDSSHATGFLQPLASGVYDAAISSPLGGTPFALLAGAVTVRLPADLVGPQEIEGTLAEGTARFRWVNPVQYSRIQLLDTQGSLLMELPGDATQVEMATGPGSTSVAVKLQGLLSDQVSMLSPGIAAIILCDSPPPLTGPGKPGELEFSIYGGHDPATLTRCTGGGGAAAPQAGGGAASDRGGGGGMLQAAGSIGYIQTQVFLLDNKLDPNVLTTGFTLDRDTDQIEVAAYVRKIAVDEGVALRCRLTHVYPDDGFSDEFTFPDILVDQPKDWDSMTYFRADKDPIDPTAQGCGLKIPKGDYLLDLYVTGGQPGISYFVFADDERRSEVLIPGAPCPPYPLVRVKDLGGRRTLPVVSDIIATAEPPESNPGCSESGGVPVRLSLQGSWQDENGGTHQLKDSAPTPQFEFYWTVFDQGQPKAFSSGHASHASTCLSNYGCYDVEIRIKDSGCPTEKKQDFEVILVPPGAPCLSGSYDFLPAAPIAAGVRGVVGLSGPTPGHGTFHGKRRLDFGVLVVPPCGQTASPKPEDLEFRLAQKLVVGNQFVDFDVSGPLLVEDLCPNQASGPKFFHVVLPDLGSVPDLLFLGDGEWANVYLEGGSTASVKKAGPSTFLNIGQPLLLMNHPKCLDACYWTGSFDPKTQSYNFVQKQGPQAQKQFPLGASNSVPIPLPGVAAAIPSYDNSYRSGFTTAFDIIGTLLEPRKGDGTSSGMLLSNKIDGAPMSANPDFPTSLNNPLDYKISWCHAVTVINTSVNSSVFSAILFAGSIGPIPVVIRAAVGLAVNFDLGVVMKGEIAPFKALVGGNFLDIGLYGLASANLDIPCEIRADILLGVASIVADLIPTARFGFDTHAGITNITPVFEYFFGLDLGIDFEAKACFFWDLACFSTGRSPLVKDASLLDVPGSTRFDIGRCEKSKGAIGQGRGGEAEDAQAGDGQTEGPASGSGADIIVTSQFLQTSTPATAICPDATTSLDAWVESDGTGVVFLPSETVNPFQYKDRHLHDPSAAFLSNVAALLVWTKSFPEDVPGSTTQSLSDQNSRAAQEEIYVTPYRRINGAWKMDPEFRVADPVAEVPDPADRRPDGRSSVAGDLAAGEALIAWVRYETSDIFVLDGTKKIPVAVDDGTGNITWEEQTVPNVRPQLEKTAIYVRRVGTGGVLGSSKKISPEGDGINIEPSISVSPSGNAACSIWVHDASPGHVDLIGSNHGRVLLASFFDKGSGTWSPPVSILAKESDYDEFYPAALEPSVTLSGDRDGLVSFTAVAAGSPETDTGLGGGSRFLYIVHLENGVFGPPILIGGKCGLRQTGHWIKAFHDVPTLVDQGVRWKVPEWVVSYHGDGTLGSPEGAGKVMVSVIPTAGLPTQAQSLTKDGNIHSNMVAAVGGGRLRTINLNQGAAKVTLTQGGRATRAAPAAAPAFEVVEVLLEPDAAITGCIPSDAFAGPGVPVTARVTVENLGLAGTPVDAADASAVGVKAYFVDPDGTERLVASSPVPVLEPGDSQVVELSIEVPHDPVTLSVRLDPDPVDRDLTNNRKDVFLGAPAPAILACRATRPAIHFEEGEPTDLLRPGVRIAWDSPAIYDEFLVYRDGAMIASVPGRLVAYHDELAPLGSHTYAVRGVIGVSKSRFATCSLDVELPPVPPTLFRRGDANADGATNISDPIAILGYLFLGINKVPCEQAGDVNDDGVLNISDPVYMLNFLFLGGNAIKPPVGTCGTDPTGHSLPCDSFPGCP